MNLPLLIVTGALVTGCVVKFLLMHPPKKRCPQCGRKARALGRGGMGVCADCLNTKARGLRAQARILDYTLRQEKPYKDKKK